MEKKLTNLKTPIAIHKFCIENSKFCIKNKNLVCKTILKISGYKVPVKWNKDYCVIYKELSKLIASVEDTTHKISKIENELYLHFDEKLYDTCKEICSDLLLEFLNFNEIIIKRKLKRSIALTNLNNPNSRETVKLKRSIALTNLNNLNSRHRKNS